MHTPRRVKAAASMLEVLEVESHQHAGFMRKDVWTFKRPDVHNLHGQECY
jgi:hypothetical protein